MSWYEASLTKALKAHDKDLYCEKSIDGMFCVFRKAKRFQEEFSQDGYRLLSLKTDKQLVLAITDNWFGSGKPRQWGIDNVLARLKEIDSQTNENYLDQIDSENEKIDRSRARDLRNNAEAFLYDARPEFKKLWKDTLTHSMPKDETKKRLRDRRIHNANY